MKILRQGNLGSMTVVLQQEADCCHDKTGDNSLSIELLDGGGGFYVAIEGRWAFNDAAEIKAFTKSICDLLHEANKKPV